MLKSILSFENLWAQQRRRKKQNASSATYAKYVAAFSQIETDCNALYEYIGTFHLRIAHRVIDRSHDNIGILLQANLLSNLKTRKKTWLRNATYPRSDTFTRNYPCLIFGFGNNLACNSDIRLEVDGHSTFDCDLKTLIVHISIPWQIVNTLAIDTIDITRHMKDETNKWNEVLFLAIYFRNKNNKNISIDNKNSIIIFSP